MDCSMPAFPVHHKLLELAQIHVHWVGDAIQPISSSVISLSSCFQFSPASGSFPVSCFFASGSQSIGATASVLPMNVQDWFPLGLTGLIYSQSKRLLSLLHHHSSKASILWCSAFFIIQLSHPYVTTGKTIALTRWNFVGKIMSLLFNIGHLSFPLCFYFMSYLCIFFMLKGGCSEFEPGKKSYPVPPCLHLIKKC